MLLKHELSALKNQFNETKKQQEQIINDLVAIIEGNGKTLTDRAVFVALELVEKLKRPVRTKEVLEAIREKNIPFPKIGASELLGALFTQELEKKQARLKRVGYGTYDRK